MAKILVIDDEPAVLLIIQRILQNAGHTVISASDGPIAIKSYETETPDLVITDMFIPEYDGVQLISHFRRLSSTLPILAVSGHSKSHRLDIATQLGVTAVLEKPFAPEDLVNAVNNALKR